jgi:hypothetical protein
MGVYGRFTHRCTVCGKGQCFPHSSLCHKAKVMEILERHERRMCNHEFVEVGGVSRWPKMCTKCGAMSK